MLFHRGEQLHLPAVLSDLHSTAMLFASGHLKTVSKLFEIID